MIARFKIKLELVWIPILVRKWDGILRFFEYHPLNLSIQRHGKIILWPFVKKNMLQHGYDDLNAALRVRIHENTRMEYNILMVDIDLINAGKEASLVYEPHGGEIQANTSSPIRLYTDKSSRRVLNYIGRDNGCLEHPGQRIMLIGANTTITLSEGFYLPDFYWKGSPTIFIEWQLFFFLPSNPFGILKTKLPDYDQFQSQLSLSEKLDVACQDESKFNGTVTLEGARLVCNSSSANNNFEMNLNGLLSAHIKFTCTKELKSYLVLVDSSGEKDIPTDCYNFKTVYIQLDKKFHFNNVIFLRHANTNRRTTKMLKSVKRKIWERT